MIEIKIHLFIVKYLIFHLSCCTNSTESDESQMTISKNLKCQIFICILSFYSHWKSITCSQVEYFQSLLFFPLIVKMLNPDSYLLLTSFFWNDSGETKQSKQHFWREFQLNCSLKERLSQWHLAKEVSWRAKKEAFS